MTPPKTADKPETQDEGIVEEVEQTADTGPARRRRARERAGDKQKRVTDARLEQACEMAAEMRHKRDCPEEGAMPNDGDRRVEFFSSRRPATDREPEQEMLVVRCIECGESEVARDESEA